MSETKVKGVWWLDKNPTKKLPGEITYGPTCGATVDLFGSLFEATPAMRSVLRFTLHGTTFQSKSISLFQCAISDFRITIPGESTCKISSLSGVEGGHFGSMDEVLCKEVRVLFDGLVEWTSITGIKTNPNVFDPHGNIETTYQIPPSISLGDCETFSARIEFFTQPYATGHVFHIDETCMLVIESNRLQPYLKFEQLVISFQRFLCLASQKPITAAQITGDVYQQANTGPQPSDCENLMIIRAIATRHRDRGNLTPPDFLFTLPDLNGSPATVFKKFVELQARSAASMDLYFSTVYNRSTLPRADFLTLAQGLEAYHRAMLPGTYMIDEAHRSALYTRLVHAISGDDTICPDFRVSLESKFKHLHEFSLRKRIKDLAKKHNALIERFIGKPEHFSSTIADLRNGLTHSVPVTGVSEGHADYQRLRSLSEQMALLLEVCFLSDLGFTEERAKQIIRRSRRDRLVHWGCV